MKLATIGFFLNVLRTINGIQIEVGFDNKS
jgi:hypothetical protein